jgi:hypothetical protein
VTLLAEGRGDDEIFGYHLNLAIQDAEPWSFRKSEIRVSASAEQVRAVRHHF